ncbi:protein YgfX [Accumulibacter sp.]|uniref:protein YgfX n=1 Tax=Accumulibacter sp. TaxID=2053492 RepID=UPI002626A4ED|nr:protein YgfX [Accumulibacter sp.]
MFFPIDIELRRSRRLLLLIVALHLVAAACLLVLPWPPAPRYLLLSLVAVSAWQALRPSRIAGLRLLASGELICVLASGERVSAIVRTDTVVFSQLVVLRVRVSETGRGDSLALLPDALSAEQFRMLRLWLRWRAIPGEPGGRLTGGV